MARARHRADRIGLIAGAAARDMRNRGMRSVCVAAPIGWTAYWICRLLVSRTDPVIPVPIALLSAAVPLLAALAWLNLSGGEEH
jgi:predicted phosphoribosyltransferase